MASGIRRDVAKTLSCPHEGHALETKTRPGPLGSLRLAVCPECKRAWFDERALALVSGDREIRRRIVEYAAGPTGLPCPRCGRELATRPVGDVTLDVCRKCGGAWADPEELERAARQLGTEVTGESEATAGDLGLERGALARGQFMGSASAVRGLRPSRGRKRPPEG